MGDNGFETTNFSGFANVEIYGGTGSEIIDLVSVDGATPANAGAEALVTLRLDGDNTGNAGQGAGSAQIGTDTAADRIHVRSLPGTVDLTIFGGAGDDQFEIFSADTAGDSANTVDLILGQIFISPTAGSGASGEDSQDEGGTDSLTIVDRADTSGDTVRFTHSGSIGGGDGVATIDGLFDAGTGVDLTVRTFLTSKMEPTHRPEPPSCWMVTSEQQIRRSQPTPALTTTRSISVRSRLLEQ